MTRKRLSPNTADRPVSLNVDEKVCKALTLFVKDLHPKVSGLLLDCSDNGTLLCAATEHAALIVRVGGCLLPKVNGAVTVALPLNGAKEISSLHVAHLPSTRGLSGGLVYSLNEQFGRDAVVQGFMQWRRFVPERGTLSGEDADFSAKEYARMSKVAKLLGVSKQGDIVIFNNGLGFAPVPLGADALGILMPLRLRGLHERYEPPAWLGL